MDAIICYPTNVSIYRRETFLYRPELTLTGGRQLRNNWQSETITSSTKMNGSASQENLVRSVSDMWLACWGEVHCTRSLCRQAETKHWTKSVGLPWWRNSRHMA